MSIFSILPVQTANAAASTIASADVDYLDDVDYDTYEHWLFDRGTSAGLTGQRSGYALTAQSAAPSYSRSYLEQSNLPSNGLVMGVADGASDVDTLTVIFKIPSTTTGTNFIFGNFTGGGGGCLFSSGSGASRTIFMSYQGVVNSLNIGSVNVNTWYFAAVARDFSGANKVLRRIIGGTAAAETTYPAVTYTAGAANQGPGNCGGFAGTTGAIRYSEFRRYARQLTLAELATVYADAKARAALRGIIVV
jgi:hypothetical protein